MPPSGATLELLTVGRICVDLYANEAGAGFDDPQTFTKSIGGTATNVAIAAARLGHRAAVFTKVGDDPFGELRASQARRLRGRHPIRAHPSGDADAAGVRRDGSAGGSAAADVPVPDGPGPDDARSREIDRQTVVRRADPVADRRVVLRRSRRDRPVGSCCRSGTASAHVVFDLDYRANFWSSATEAGADIGPVLDHVTVAVGNRTECEVAVGSGDPPEAARRLLERGVELAIVKMGGDGVMVATADGIDDRAAPRGSKVVCGLGAGDAFGGMLVHGLLSGWEPARDRRVLQRGRRDRGVEAAVLRRDAHTGRGRRGVGGSPCRWMTRRSRR